MIILDNRNILYIFVAMTWHILSTSGKRITELDYLKSVFILLMIVFHLVYIGNHYPVAKAFVYTFHMPGFLIISGYLFNMHKSVGKFAHYIQWLFVPYFLMESGYVAMAAVLPICEHIYQFSFMLYVDKLFLHPIGPYWYLHTLMLCGTVSYLVSRLSRKAGIWRIGLVFGILVGCSFLGIIERANAFYFCAGLCLRHYGGSFIKVFHPSCWSVIVVILIIMFMPNSLHKYTFWGMMIVYFMFSFLLGIYYYLPMKVANLFHFIGRNSLVLLLFSPIFTVLAKLFQPYLLIEPTGMLFMLVALTFTVVGCFAIVYLLQWLHLVRFIFGKDTVVR